MSGRTMLETLHLIERSHIADNDNLVVRDDLRHYIRGRYPEHADNLETAFKAGYITKGRFYGFFLSDKGVRKVKELTNTPTLVRLGDHKYRTAIVDEDGNVIRWTSDIHEEVRK